MERKRFMRRAALTAVLAGTVAGATTCGGGHPEAAAEAEPLAVRTAPAAEADWVDRFEAGGVIQARTTAVLSSRILAPVRTVRVAPGDRVRAGQVLVELDARDLTAGAGQARAGADAASEAIRVAAAERAAAEAALSLARATHGRIAALRERNSATAQELDEAVAALEAARARASSAVAAERAAQASLASAQEASGAAGITASYARITAPFDGIVTEKLVEPGNLVAPGTPLLRIEDVRGFRLEVRVDESRAADLDVGDAAQVLVGDTTVAGRVAELARAVDADARAYLVKIALPDDGAFRSGAFGRARFEGRGRSVLHVPESAVLRQGQVASVFVVDDGRARLRLVRAGDVRDGQVEIVAGLSPGERVILSPPPALVDGRPVREEGGRS